jgi:hypothetical protein
MSLELSAAGSVAAVQSQASILTLAKALKLEQSAAAQLLQGLPGAGTATPRTGPAVAGMGQQLDAFA